MDYVRSATDVAAGDAPAERIGGADATESRPHNASGRYQWKPDAAPWPLAREVLRLDVDGSYPQMAASGTLHDAAGGRLHWVASLTAAGGDRWSGGIWLKDGIGALLPHTHVDVTVRRRPFAIGQTATAVFSGGGIAARTHEYHYASRYLRPVELEVDRLEGAPAVPEIGTCARPDRPAALPAETLSIEKVLRRAGLNVGTAGSGNALPMAAGGSDAAWTDLELHDAMQVYWSHFGSRADRAAWLLIAALHEAGAGVGGITFEGIGPQHRPGAVLFTNSFLGAAPAGDPDPALWTARSRFCAACHGIGHALDLAHASRTWRGSDWIPPTDGPPGASFMSGDVLSPDAAPAFFNAFDFRFSDAELLYARHAPERPAHAGMADWFDLQGFESAGTEPHPALRLELRADRQRPVFEFLEPAVLELLLTNDSDQSMPVDGNLLDAGGDMTIIIKKDGAPARQWFPFARYCRKAPPRLLGPGQFMTESLFAAAGRNGWDLAEPGMYELQAALHIKDEIVMSNRLRLRIATPRNFDEEAIAQDFFSDAVGRILSFGGSCHLQAGNDTLREIADRLSGRRVAAHAHLALAGALARPCKQLVLDGGEEPLTSAADAGGRICLTDAQPEAARAGFEAALTRDPAQAAETFGHTVYARHLERFARWRRDLGQNS